MGALVPEDGVVGVVTVMRQPGMGWDGVKRALAGENNPAVIAAGGGWNTHSTQYRPQTAL